MPRRIWPRHVAAHGRRLQLPFHLPSFRVVADVVSNFIERIFMSNLQGAETIAILREALERPLRPPKEILDRIRERSSYDPSKFGAPDSTELLRKDRKIFGSGETA